MDTLRYKWFFGDGTISYEKSPTHIFRMPGVYKVSMYARSQTADVWTLIVTQNVTVYDWDLEIAGLNVSRTDTCLRFAIPQQPGQGKGWSIYDGADWPFPEGVVGTTEVVNDLEERIQLVTDAYTYRTYRLGTEENWKDGDGEYSAGSEIESEITLREHLPPIGANALLEHMQSHINVKPWFKDRRSTGEYNSEGYRPAFAIDYYIKKDALPDRFAIAKVVPKNGQIVYDRNAKSEYLQQGVVVTGAPWRIVSFDLRYQQIDSAGNPDQKNMTEMQQRDQLSGALLWFSRHRSNMRLNLATGIEAGGGQIGYTTGPDGYTQTAVTAGPGFPWTANPASSMTGDATFSIWVKNAVSPITLFSTASGMSVVLGEDGTGWFIQYEDGTSTIKVDLTGNFASWVYLVIQRHGNNLEVYRNGTLVDTRLLGDPNIEYSGLCTIYDGSGSWFDARILGRALDAGTTAYIYDDVTQNSANSICPMV